MRILATNTTTEACSVALLNNGIIYSHFEKCYKEHTRRIIPLINKILNQSNIILDDLDVLAFGRGPGSFTGVRIGIGIMQGLALGASLPMIGVSTMVTMAQGAWRKIKASQVLVAIDAKMNEIYWAEYIRDNRGIWHGEKTESVLKFDIVNQRLKELTGEWAIVGTGWHVCSKMIHNSTLSLVNCDILLPEAEDMLPIACYLFASGRSVAVEHAEPIYLRNKIAQKLPNRNKS